MASHPIDCLLLWSVKAAEVEKDPPFFSCVLFPVVIVNLSGNVGLLHKSNATTNVRIFGV